MDRKLFVCPRCAFMRCNASGEIKICNCCQQAMLIETAISECDTIKLSCSHLEDYFSFCREIYKSIIEPIGLVDKDSICFRENYANYYGLPMPNDVVVKKEAAYKKGEARYHQIQMQQQFDKRLKCPVCHSVEVEKISALNRAASVSLLGLASSKIGKQYKCKKCGHMW